MNGQCNSRSKVTFPAAEHHRTVDGNKLYCLVTEAHVCEQLARSRYMKVERPGMDSDPRHLDREFNDLTITPPPCT